MNVSRTGLAATVAVLIGLAGCQADPVAVWKAQQRRSAKMSAGLPGYSAVAYVAPSRLAPRPRLRPPVAEPIYEVGIHPVPAEFAPVLSVPNGVVQGRNPIQPPNQPAPPVIVPLDDNSTDAVDAGVVEIYVPVPYPVQPPAGPPPGCPHRDRPPQGPPPVLLPPGPPPEPPPPQVQQPPDQPMHTMPWPRRTPR